MPGPFLAKTPKETAQFAKRLLGRLLKMRPNKPAIIALSGELGAGKTTLIQGLARALGIKEKIQSPTFVLMKTYRLPRAGKLPWKFMVHMDVYRIERKKEMSALKPEKFFRNPDNLVVVEWAEKIKNMLPAGTLWVELKHKGGNHRHIIVKSQALNSKL